MDHERGKTEVAGVPEDDRTGQLETVEAMGASVAIEDTTGMAKGDRDWDECTRCCRREERSKITSVEDEKGKSKCRKSTAQ